jgi:hypothetical protein
VDPRSYIERIAQELSRARGRGLVLSPADAQLALGWHAAGIALDDVLEQIRRMRRKHPPSVRRGATQLGISLQVIERSMGARRPRPPVVRPSESLSANLLRACRAGLPGGAYWQTIAERTEELLALGPERYWSELVSALRKTVREMPRERVRDLSRALRARMAPRPRTMGRDAYRRSLQLQLLSAASERLGVPPREFLL